MILTLNILKFSIYDSNFKYFEISENLATVAEKYEICHIIKDQNLTIFERMEQKIDRILLILDSNNKEQNTSSSLLGLLPFGINDFIMLNESLKTNKTLKEQIKQLILSCHGKDCKAFVANSLRRLITDDVAICYSLTGKNKTGQLKESFEKTEVFKMIREACLLYKNFKDNIFREAASDWLLQAKFRKMRKEKRMAESMGDV
ncbi:uncharacterized protein [Parasteatoda tepidariorum]|uniref:uncharacterized protein n=1 Tax=Parasteatoda tepidariorum TaxID=114398 RepID=UPI0039BCBC18